jgi:hypothetical protein
MATLLFRAIGPEPPHNGRSGSALLQSLPGRSGCIDDRPIDGANIIFLLKSGNLRRGVDRAGLAVTVSSWWPGRPREKGRQTRYLACVRPAFFDATPVEWGLIANNQAPYKTAADLIAAAKAAPGKIDYGSGGPGSPQHLAMAMFASAAGISLTHVPYKGATQAATDIAAGQIPVGFQGFGTVAALVRGGQLRLIGVTTQSRLPQFPDVPTASESGLPGFFFNSWFAILAPAGTPKDIIAKLNADVVKVVGDPEIRRKLEDLGFYGARQLGRGAARHDTRSAREICPGDQGDGYR